MASYLASDLMTQVRTVTDHDSDQQITDAQIYSLLDPVVRTLQRQCADIAPDLFTQVTADVTLTTGQSTIDLTAAPLSLTDVGKVLTVELKTGTAYRALPLVPLMLGSNPRYLGWRLRGEALIEFMPPELAPHTYRVKYLAKAPKIVTGAEAVALPDGADAVVVERCAARVRPRFDEDPSPHIAAANQAWTDLRGALVRTYPSAPVPVIDVTGRY